MNNAAPRFEMSISKTRTLPRYSCDIRAKVMSGGDDAMAYGRLVDISEGGMGLYCAASLDESAVLTLEFSLPHSIGAVKTRVAVRNRNGNRYGLEFLALTDIDKDRLARFCRVLALFQK